MKFVYQASDQVGETVRGEMDAPTKEVVFSSLTKRGLTPLSIKKAVSETKGTSGKGIFKKSLSPMDRILLARHLAAVLRAGIPVVESIEIIGSDAKEGMMKSVLRELRASLERGETLAAGFSRFPNTFSDIFIGLIRAGENSGTLDKNLESLAIYLKKEYELKRNIRSAMFYPSILFMASIVIVVVMVVFVLPRITKAFEQSGIKMPAITKLMLDVSHFFSDNVPRTLVLIGLAIAGLLFLFLSKPGKLILERVSMRIPVISGIVKQLALSRFAGILSNLLKSGLPAVESLDITSKSVGNRYYQKEIARAAESIKKGISIADSFRGKGKYFPNVLTSMIAIGEKSGTLDETLGTLATFYEEEVDRLIKNALALIEPLMLLIMGGVVAFIAISILLPIYQLVSGFS